MLVTPNKYSLHHEVLEALEFEPKISSGEIGIALESDVVTLSGVVCSFAEKWAAETATRGVRGVRGIVNDIHVDLPGMHRYGDLDLAKTAIMFLKWDTLLPETIQVSVEDANVTLHGTVAHHYQKRDAQEALSRLVGVRSITNHIEVRPGFEPRDVALKIEARFRKDAAFDADKVLVEARDGNIKLSGEVRSLAERDGALSVAWSVPGVYNVEDCLTIRS